MIRRAALTWVAMIPVAILNGTFREVALKRVLDDQPARQISVATASLAFLVLVYLIMREYVVDETDQRLLRIGLTWLAATILFEFGFGHFIDGKSWGELAHDYNIFAGRLWPIFLGIEAAAPLLIKQFVMHQGNRVERGQRPHGPRPQGAV
jgi:hypothetical protein